MRKKIFVLLLLAIGITGIMFFSGCEPTDIFTDEESVREKYIGTWSCRDGQLKDVYEVYITANPSNSSQILIRNYFNVRGSVYAIVTESTVTVPEQRMDVSVGTYYCEGQGAFSLKNGTPTITWSLYAANNDEFSAVFTKK